MPVVVILVDCRISALSAGEAVNVLSSAFWPNQG